MKRAARHFGEKTGNALYHSGFSVNNAPKNLKDAFEQFDVHRAKSRFGFEKDRVAANENAGACTAQQMQTNVNNAAAAVKQEVKTVHSTTYNANQPKPISSYGSNQPKPTPTNVYNTQQAQRAMPQPQPTPASANNIATITQKTPHNANNNAAAQNNACPTAASYVTPYNANVTGANKTNRVSTGGVDYSVFTATPAAKPNFTGTSTATTATVANQSINKENSNPQQTNASGLSLPPRPGTSRGQSNMNDGMLGLASSILAMNGHIDPSTEVSQKTTVKNPYNALG
jgi:hypothetical protein